MNLLRRLMGSQSREEETTPRKRIPEAMTEAKVDFSFRIYWTKMTRKWSAERRAEVRQQVLTITQSPTFDNNMIEKRYPLPLDDIPEQIHSGASLVALLEVLGALDAAEESE